MLETKYKHKGNEAIKKKNTICFDEHVNEIKSINMDAWMKPEYLLWFSLFKN